ncbi:MAG: pyruvate kinase [Armatimonadota bacterium]|nr:pyruvate kinase [Armatimonadota bacterium]
MSTPSRTKIVVTLGPASASPEVIRGMLEAGASVVRLNFSHGTPDDHLRRLETAREAARALGLPLAVLQDLPGPKLRIGPLPEEAITLREGQEVLLAANGAAHGGDVIPLAYAHLADDVRPGHRIFLQDGDLALVVRAVEASCVRCTVEAGGVLRQHAGVNVPGVRLSGIPAMTDDDLRALEWGLAHDVDFLGLSFVEAAEDLERARRLVAARGGRARLVAKIERRRALDRIEEIVAAADAVMVARGDLAVETAIEEVPVVQKSIIALCNRLGRPVITATQMLESMITHPRPTRAEAADVANAVFDGTDALMLSGETALGAYPVAAVATMATIARRAEAALPYDLMLRERRRERAGQTSEAIALAACEAAEAVGAAAIVAATESGATALRVSRYRPRRPIVAVTHNPATSRMLALAWGVRPALVEPVRDLDELVARGVRAAVELGVAGPGDQVVVTAGFPLGRSGTTNFLKVVQVDQALS